MSVMVAVPILDHEAEDWSMADPTICRDCDFVHPDTRGKPPFSWRCMKYPAPPFGGVVNPDFRPDPPYLKCERVNNGQCEFWTPKRDAANV